MNLRQFLSTLTTPNVQVKLVDADTDKDMLTFFAAGYENLDDTIETRPVKFWSIISTTSIKVILSPAVVDNTTTTPTTDTTPTTEETPTTDTQPEG